MEAQSRNLRKQRTGVVVSNKMDKTISVSVEKGIAPYLRQDIEEIKEVSCSR